MNTAQSTWHDHEICVQYSPGTSDIHAWGSGHSTGHIPRTYYPGQFCPDNFPYSFTRCRTFPFHQNRPPIYIIKRPTVSPSEFRGNYSATANNMKFVHWPLMGGLLHLVQRGGDWAGPQPTQAPPRCTKCNSPPIDGQCINHRIVV